MPLTDQHRGSCYDCETPVSVGDLVEYNDFRHLAHVSCPGATRVLTNGHLAPPPTCSMCCLKMAPDGLGSFHCEVCDE